MSAHRHAIIAGVNKCGTTSVFRYLAQHPHVSASRIKETRYFVRDNKSSDQTRYSDYWENFGEDAQRGQLMLEASPTYFTSGAEVGIQIRRELPDVRIIVILRNPIERLISYYRSALIYDNYANEFICGLSFSEFINQALEAVRSEETGGEREAEFRRSFDQGNYARHIQKFGAQFPDDQIQYFFFEELVSDTRGLMKKVCGFLELDEQFFEDYEFSVENKSRTFRSMTMQRLGYRLNMKLEPFFNRRPGLRQLAQTVYRRINEKGVAVDFESDPSTLAKLTEYYRDPCRELGQILGADNRVGKLPAWLALHGS